MQKWITYNKKVLSYNQSIQKCTIQNTKRRIPYLFQNVHVLPSYKIMLHCRFSLFLGCLFSWCFSSWILMLYAYKHNLRFPLWSLNTRRKKDQISLQTSTRNKQEDWRSSIFTHLSILRRNDVKGWFMSSILCLLYLLCNRKRLRKCLW